MIAAAAFIGALASISGLLVSYHAGLATGPTIILSAGVLYIFSLLVGPHGGLVRQWAPGRHLEA